jgi:hypothetical protein
MSPVRDADKLVLPQVRHTIEQLPLLAADSAAATLAERYADAIDQPSCPECGGHKQALIDLGPKLLAVLESLGATPKARTAAVKGGESAGQGALARLRAARTG